ncbi:hypothetical protein SCLCIDRAFT_1158453, partial [Scleroderma citrinum Foug A]
MKDDGILWSEIFGLEVSNPVGLAASFDKHGEAIDRLLNLGFSWVEIGSVTPKLELTLDSLEILVHLPVDAALINWYGFNSEGATAVLAHLHQRIPVFNDISKLSTSSLRSGAVLTVNLGKNKVSSANPSEDFITGIKTFRPYADVLVINVSSPNTPGLCGLQNWELLESLLRNVVKVQNELPPSLIVIHRPCLVLRIALDLEELQLTEMAEVIRDSDIDDIIISNMTIAWPS